ncbi:hypothetical protein [Pantoea sp. SOD02]|uniref:winged helix-turn-helix domain-containing protein n=1 Tax=Pantoea sp. SOD02 TaxID=2970818 RepID=UPI0012ADCA9F|nr:hypothetical protein [Pantoea sp. SOD02]MRS18699.1 hypothetical protein [Enterobacteriaceae bacterium RIT692]UVC32139.1 hypothetical protein NR302_21490 [Pantoea sp. SOD02]
MLTDEQAQLLLTSGQLNYEDILLLDCAYNKITLPQQSITFSVNEAQKRLMLCMLNKISCKREIIKVVWNDNHQRIRDNNYHQLVFQFRALLQRNGLPANLIVTVPYYGLKLNEPLLRELHGCGDAMPEEPRKLLPQLLSFARSLF